ncbi:heavy-metal-associated domain-containing protein [Glutamicibacter sp.]|uniref:heavy-metal-associated domain-containing protein n=1 Tax=Glutamicibacter sp. TaxID=1931995 RepID=UPI002FDFD46E
MSCNCGCSSENNATPAQGLQITTREQATPLSNQTEIKISGMTCGHCVASVTEELKELSGVQNVDVLLDAQGISTATVTSTEKLSESSIREAIDEAGYTVEAINA